MKNGTTQDRPVVMTKMRLAYFGIVPSTPFMYQFDRPEDDATGRAELVAVREASHRYPPERLAGATLYSSAEPCAMYACAIYWSGISRVVYALSEERLLSLTGNHPENPTLSLPCREVFARGQRAVVVVGPMLEDEAMVTH